MSPNPFSVHISWMWCRSTNLIHPSWSVGLTIQWFQSDLFGFFSALSIQACQTVPHAVFFFYLFLLFSKFFFLFFTAKAKRNLKLHAGWNILWSNACKHRAYKHYDLMTLTIPVTSCKLYLFATMQYIGSHLYLPLIAAGLLRCLVSKQTATDEQLMVSY